MLNIVEVTMVTPSSVTIKTDPSNVIRGLREGRRRKQGSKTRVTSSVSVRQV